MNQQLQRGFQLSLLAKDLATLKCRARGTSHHQTKVRQIVDRLGLLHGLPQKIGQLLSFSELNDTASDFRPLTESDPTLAPDQAFEEIERQLGCSPHEHFRHINPRGISASIGQVHHAVLHDGREVAIKVQHPGVAEQISWDLQALGWLTMPIGDLRKGFDLTAYRTEIGNMLRLETDYSAEAEAIRDFQALTRNWSSLQIPEVITELSRPRLLTTTWVRGSRLQSTGTFSPTDRELFANTLLTLFLKGIFEWRVLHADPHPGNYRFQASDSKNSAKLGLLDFGCVKTVSVPFADALHLLITASMESALTADLVWQGFLQMGFNPHALGRLRPQLVDVIKILCEPFNAKEPFAMSRWNLSQRLAALLGKDRMTFRTAGPAEMLYFLRAYQGLLHYLKCLDTPVSWRRAFLDCCPRKSRQIGATNLPPAADKTMKSETLHIHVKEGTETVVSMTFGADAAQHLDQLVPLDLKAKLHHRSIDLVTVANRAQQSGYAPGELFAWQDGSRSVRVWLA